jgi:hypothetical protein
LSSNSHVALLDVFEQTPKNTKNTKEKKISGEKKVKKRPAQTLSFYDFYHLTNGSGHRRPPQGRWGDFGDFCKRDLSLSSGVAIDQLAESLVQVV